MSLEAAFAIPGDLRTVTGGYIYERRLLETLRETGTPVRHVALSAGWPHPTPDLMAEAEARLGGLPAGLPLILDGLVFGALDTALLAGLPGPVVAMLHHPLGLEAGLAPARAAALIASETANLRYAAQVVVPSDHTARLLVSDFGLDPARLSVAAPGFDRPPLRPVPPPVDPPLILSVGLVCRRKGHDVLLAALNRIAHLPWQAVICGMIHDPGEAEALQAQRAALHLEGRVRLAGLIPDEALETLWRQARLFALATRYEGYGMVISEAMLRGVPVVSCAVGAVPQTLPPGAGLLVPPDDPHAFAGALAALLTDGARHSACAAAAKAAGAALPHWTDTAAVMGGALGRARAGWVPKA
jgi:glycosyltransferase involved in cell wall biosynthesis